jgi:spore germination protein YaaH
MYRLIICIILFIVSPISFATEAAFYTLRGESIKDYQQVSQWMATMRKHPGLVNIIISQAYQVDQNGTVWGEINSQLINFTHKQHIKFIAMITDADFSASVVNAFLHNSYAQQKTIQQIVTLAKQNKFYGIQMDFEHVPVQDRQYFTTFYQNLADALHQQDIKISAALFPLTSNTPPTNMLKQTYNGWAGAYDYKAIGAASDFVSIMAYDQHMGATTPGPMASIPWDKKIIAYTLKYIPADKVSLGIPTYSGIWQTSFKDGHMRAIGDDLDYASMQAFLKENHAKLHWDAEQQIPFTIFNKDQFNQYIFAENAKSFAAKLALVKEYHLRGFSAWRLGMEDPGIWFVLHS